jgi:NTE family protein
MSVPKTDWDKSERPPNDLQLLLKATGVPIDLYSYEAVELLRDTLARWRSLRALKAAAESSGGDSQLVRAAEVPDIELYAIDVSFAAHPDPAEREYLNAMPTSFVLSAEQVDRLRAAAGVVVRESPEYQRLLRDLSLERPPPSVPEVPPMLR